MFLIPVVTVLFCMGMIYYEVYGLPVQKERKEPRQLAEGTDAVGCTTSCAVPSTTYKTILV